MSPRQPRHLPRIRAQITPCRMTNLLRPIQPLDPQPVGILLPPVDRAVLAIHAQPQPVPLARRHLRSHQNPARPVLQPEDRIAIVVQPPPFHHCPQRGIQACDPEPGHILRQVKRMRADVPDAAARPIERRIGAPRGLLLSTLFNRLAQPPLQILHSNLANRPQPPARTD